MFENLMNALIIAIIYSIILTVIGIITKITIRVDIGFWINFLIVLAGGIWISVYVFTNTDKPMLENFNVLVSWFLYMVLFVIVPMAISEPISSMFYSYYNRNGRNY